VVREAFSLVNKVSAPRSENGATQDASAEKTFFVFCASMVVITKSHRDERTDSRAAWLAGPTAEFGFDVSQASRKET
jgi:hypothetical protein